MEGGKEEKNSLLGEGQTSSEADLFNANPFAAQGSGDVGEISLQGGDATSQLIEDPFVSTEDFYKDDTFQLQQTQPQSQAGDINPAPENPQPAWSVGESEVNKKMEEIKRKETELAEREAALKLQEEEQNRLRKNAGMSDEEMKKKNFPPCYPLVRNDIKSDIPAPQQALVKYGFICWVITEIGYILNFSAGFLLMITGNMKFSDFLMNFFATASGVPLSWIFWYQALYHAAQTEAAVFAHMKFFFHFSFHIFFCALAFLSPPVIGGFNAGLFTMIYEFENKDGGVHKFFGVLCLINTLVWLACGLLSLWIIQWTFRIFRRGGGVEATQQAGAAALIAANASINTFGSTATTQKPASIP